MCAAPGPYGRTALRVFSGSTENVLQAFEIGEIASRFADSIAALLEERLVYFGSPAGGRPCVEAFRLRPLVDR